MAVLNLSYAATRAGIKVLKDAFLSDPLFVGDKTGKSRSAETMVLDTWGNQQRDFPCVVVLGQPGSWKPMGIGGDTVRPFFGVPLAEEPGGTQTLRTFDVPLACVVGSTLNLRYSGDVTGMNPPPPWNLEVKQKTVMSTPINYVELTGTNIGPASAFPLKNFEASIPNYPTGQVFGGWYDAKLIVTGAARNTTTRQLLGDRILAVLSFEKKKALRKLGIVVKSVDFSGFAEIPYGADLLYQVKFTASIGAEFEAIVQFAETVTDVSVVGTAVSTLP